MSTIMVLEQEFPRSLDFLHDTHRARTCQGCKSLRFMEAFSIPGKGLRRTAFWEKRFKKADSPGKDVPPVLTDVRIRGTIHSESCGVFPRMRKSALLFSLRFLWKNLGFPLDFFNTWDFLPGFFPGPLRLLNRRIAKKLP